MVSKYLEKRVELLPDSSLNEFEKPFILEYFLLESEENDYEELKGEKVYGIEIIKFISDTEVERSTVTNLSYNKEFAGNILNKLVYNTVTPVSVPFILDDIIGI